MATYTFRCPACGDQDSSHPMATVPGREPCRACGGEARRVVVAPRLSLGDQQARRLLDATQATSEQPQVVSAPPAGRARQRTTSNPLHARLPRP